MKPEERALLEAMHFYQKKQGEDLAECTAAVVELGNNAEAVSDAVREAVGKLGQLFDEVKNMNERLGLYIKEASKERSGIRDVDRRLRIVESRFSPEVKAGEGG